MFLCTRFPNSGSIIRPASFCGVWGFKPSFGLIPRTGVLKTTDTLDTVGILSSHGSNLEMFWISLELRDQTILCVQKYR